jgi:osmotically-inducible protein OsmY
MRNLLILLTVSILLCFGCSQQTVNNPPAQKQDETGTAAKKDSGTPAKGGSVVVTRVVTKDDSAVATRVKNQIETNSEAGPIRINIETDDGVVTLTGTAPNAAAKARVEELVRGTEGVKRVANNITLDLRSADGKVSDATILTKINSEFTTADIRGANVAVNDGHVLLRGEVETAQEKANAEAIARKTEGVKDVANQLTIKKSSDGKISDSAIMTKIKSQLVTENISGAEVAVTNGNVLLKGEVDSAQDKAQADAIARRTEGVKSVNNRLTVKRFS